jgi:hypothetical protein
LEITGNEINELGLKDFYSNQKLQILHTAVDDISEFSYVRNIGDQVIKQVTQSWCMKVARICYCWHVPYALLSLLHSLKVIINILLRIFGMGSMKLL